MRLAMGSRGGLLLLGLLADIRKGDAAVIKARVVAGVVNADDLFAIMRPSAMEREMGAIGSI